MNKIIITFFVCTFLFPCRIYAFELGKIRSAIKYEPINIEDVKYYLDMNIFKYKLRLVKDSKINITFKNIKQNQLIFNHEIEIEDDNIYTIRLMFKKEEGFPGNALNKDEKIINYSLNWNYIRVFSGSISNPLHGYESIYYTLNSFEFGQVINGRTSLIKFYTHGKESDKAELIAEIFLDFDPNK